MSAQYPVLYDRPINKWKVAELKEELKRRNLMVKGLKDDLVRRLDEAIRNESSNLQPQGQTNLDHTTVAFGNTVPNLGLQVQSDSDAFKEPLNVYNHPKPLPDDLQITADAQKKDGSHVAVDNWTDIAEGTLRKDEGKTYDSSLVGSGLIGNANGASHIVDKLLASPNAVNEDVFGNSGATMEKDDLGEAGRLEASPKSGDSLNEPVVRQVATSSETMRNSITSPENEHSEVVPFAAREKVVVSSGSELGNEYLKPIQMDATSQVTHSSNQVYEVNSNFGVQVRYESITTDNITLSNFEKTEINENLNDNNFQLDPKVVRQESLQSSSHKDSSGGDSFYASEVKVLGVKEDLIIEADDKHNMISCEKTYITDAGSVMDHTMENKGPGQVAGDNELGQLPSAANMNQDDMLNADMPSECKDPSLNENIDIGASTKGRLLDDKSTTANNTDSVDMTDVEPLEKINLNQSSADDSVEDDTSETKNTDSYFNQSKVGEENKSTEESLMKADSVNAALRTDNASNMSDFSDANNDRTAPPSQKRKIEENNETRKRQRRWNEGSAKMPEQPGLNVSLSKVSIMTPIVDGRKSTEGDSANERVVPPSSKAPTNSLCINNFLRPFTLKSVQELLSRTGSYSAFWMDHIKTHCYVTYTSIEEAVETRNAVYNLQWPANGGRLLNAEFVDPEEVKMRVEGSSRAAAPVISTSSVPPPQTPPAKQQQVPDPQTRREQLSRPRSPPPVAQAVEPPIVTLDDLFKKTRATPRIYYLPLTDEQVAAKLATKSK